MKRYFVALAGLLVGSVSAQAVAGPSFQGLGGSSPGSTITEAYDVSGNGSTIVGAFRTDPDGDDVYDYHPYRWENGIGGYLPMPGTGGYAWGGANAVSDDGTAIAGWVGGTGWEASRWYYGTPQRLGWLTSGAEEPWSSGYGVTEDGAVVVGSSYYDATHAGWDKAFYWDGTMSALPFLVEGGLNPDRYSYAYGVARPDDSPASFVAVGSSGRSAQQPCRWNYEPGRAVDVQALSTLGYWSGEANAISADASTIVGYVGSLYSYSEPVRWQSGTAVPLGSLGGPWGTANDVSGDGEVIVGYSARWNEEFGDFWPDAFIFDEVDGLRSLKWVLEEEHGLDLTDWDLLFAEGISADGTTIVGYGFNPDGWLEAWRAVIPEPATLCLFALSLALARRRH